MSGNAKTGLIPVSTSSSSTCPDNCSFKGDGCYADTGPLQIHWKKVSAGERGTDLDTFCAQIRKLPKFQLWRHNQAGDLAGRDGVIDQVALHKLVSANRGRHGFTYTHYDPTNPDNARALAYANGQGFTVNLSAETLDQVDQYLALGVGPVVVTLPADARGAHKTPLGHDVITCPTYENDSVSCATCAICQKADRKTVIGFPAHGSGKKRVEAIFWAKPELQAA